MLSIEFSNRQTTLPVDTACWERLLVELFRSEGIRGGEVSVSIVHADEIHRLNREYLAHDYPTDVLSFPLERQNDQIHGEIVVSADMAVARCNEFGLSAQDELTLYLIHGALHLAGYDDKSSEQCQRMREREQYYLQRRDLSAPSEQEGSAASVAGAETAAVDAAERMPGE